MKFDETVKYLQVSDVAVNGNDVILTNKHIPKNVPVIVMLQADYCHYCTEAKPAFQEAARLAGDSAFFATIQADGNQPGEKELATLLQLIDKSGFKGFPTYVRYEGGRYVSTHAGGRDVNSIIEFAS